MRPAHPRKLSERAGLPSRAQVLPDGQEAAGAGVRLHAHARGEAHAGVRARPDVPAAAPSHVVRELEYLAAKATEKRASHHEFRRGSARIQMDLAPGRSLCKRLHEAQGTHGGPSAR